MGKTFGLVIERLTAIAGLIAALPFLAFLGALVALIDGRPVFFSQTRIGRHGEPFRLWKFRTMRTGIPGTAITAGGDQRITRLGARLRQYKLDELPQLWNVAVGDMSLIGPRPEVPAFVDRRDPLWDAVLRARPGITDLATIVFRNEEDELRAAADTERYYREVLLPRKLALNLKYNSVRSWRTDVKLVWLTLRYSFHPAGFDAGQVQRCILSKVPK
jgi:lipopolysaccharide/colanic/teichoic acid biosynthesis glycosyltransferase